MSLEPVSDHFDGERFYNPGRPRGKKSLLQVLRWRLTANRLPWPKWIENKAQPNLPSQLEAGEVAVTFINHASWLIQIPGLNIITDPVYSERTSPSQLIGPQRVRNPGLRFEDLPVIDVVLVSHNHYDHMDESTLRRLAKRDSPRFLVAKGDRRKLESWNIANVQELDWWDEISLDAQTRAIFTPTQHWSGRGLADSFASLWGGFAILQKDLKIYFGGDAGYSPWFKETFRRLGAMDLALIPIGAYEPEWFMRENHMNPFEAVKAHQDLQSRHSVGIHFGCWRLTDEPIDEPERKLKEACAQAALKAGEFTTLEVGETRIYQGMASPR